MKKAGSAAAFSYLRCKSRGRKVFIRPPPAFCLGSWDGDMKRFAGPNEQTAYSAESESAEGNLHLTGWAEGLRAPDQPTAKGCALAARRKIWPELLRPDSCLALVVFIATFGLRPSQTQRKGSWRRAAVRHQQQPWHLAPGEGEEVALPGSPVALASGDITLSSWGGLNGRPDQGELSSLAWNRIAFRLAVAGYSGPHSTDQAPGRPAEMPLAATARARSEVSCSDSDRPSTTAAGHPRMVSGKLPISYRH